MMILDSGLLFWATLYIYTDYITIICHYVSQSIIDRLSSQFTNKSNPSQQQTFYIALLSAKSDGTLVTAHSAIAYVHRLLIFELHSTQLKSSTSFDRHKKHAECTGPKID